MDEYGVNERRLNLDDQRDRLKIQLVRQGLCEEQGRSFLFRKSNQPAIQTLLLRNNHLASMEPFSKTLAAMSPSLKELTLRNNDLAYFPLELLVLTNLTSLSLAKNQLNEIPDSIFPHLCQLMWLSLSDNQLTTLPIDLASCPRLRGLDISCNHIQVFPSVISHLAELEVLLLQKNLLDSLPEGPGVFPDSLQTVNLSFNQLEEVPPTLVYYPPAQLTHLHISGNPLGNLPMDFLQHGYQNLVSLDLHTCGLTRISPMLFITISQRRIPLVRLNLAINSLVHLPSTVGQAITLQWFNLNDNRLRTLPASMGNLDQLVKLGLVQNRLQHLPPFIFQNMKSLEKIDLRRNSLMYLPPSLLTIAPAAELDQHLHLSVPTSSFPCSRAQPRFYRIQNQWIRARTGIAHSQPTCQPLQQDGLSMMVPPTRGGSLKTLLLYENDTLEHQDGLFVFQDGEWCPLVSLAQLRAWQPMTPVLEQSPLQWQRNVKKKWLEDAKRVADTIGQSQELLNQLLTAGVSTASILDATNVVPALHQVPTLKDLALQHHLRQCHREWVYGAPTVQKSDNSSQDRTHLNDNIDERVYPDHDDVLLGRLDIDPDLQCHFLSRALSMAIPAPLRDSIIQQARQCDSCRQWSTNFIFQVGYLARICNNRMQVPVRYAVCSIHCALASVHRLEVATQQWHRQGASNGGTQSTNATDSELPLGQQQLTQFFSPAPHREPSPPMDNHAHVALDASHDPAAAIQFPRPPTPISESSSSPPRSASSSPSSFASSLFPASPTAAPPSSSSTTASSSLQRASAVFGPVNPIDDDKSPSFTRVLQRVEQLATSFIQRASPPPSAMPAPRTVSSSSPSSSSSTFSNTSMQADTMLRTHTSVSQDMEPASSPTSLTFDHALVIQSPTLLHVRRPPTPPADFPSVAQLIAPRPSLTSFNHLPRDALRLERF